MSVPATQDFTFYSGDTDTIELVVKDSNGVVVDLTGGSARMQVKVKSNDSTALLTKTATIDGVNGKITFALSDTDTSGLNSDNFGTKIYVYDVELTYPAGDIKTLIAGKFSVSADVTR